MANKFKDKNEKELKDMLLSKRDALRKFRFAISGSKIKNVKEGKGLKKDIAKILTTINTLNTFNTNTVNK